MIRIFKYSLGLMGICFLVLSVAGIVQRVNAAVTMVSFNAFPGNQQVILEWETASETDMLGFYITRNDHLNGEYARVSNFIFTQGTSVSGLVYQYIDSNLTNEKTYYYKLEALENNYDSEFFGPISATPLQTTATLTQTLTLTSTVALNTLTFTPIIRMSPTLDQTKILTPSLSPTSTFSFNTNTPTITSTTTARIPPTISVTDTPDLTLTPEITRTYKIIHYNVFTPTITPVPAEINPLKRGLVGFIVTLLAGFLLIILLIIFQRKHRPD